MSLSALQRTDYEVVDKLRANYDFNTLLATLDNLNSSNEWKILFSSEKELVNLCKDRDTKYVHGRILTPGEHLHYRDVPVHSSYHPKMSDADTLDEYLDWPCLLNFNPSVEKASIEKMIELLSTDSALLNYTDKFFQRHRKYTLARLYMETGDDKKALDLFYDPSINVLDLIGNPKTFTSEEAYIKLNSSLPRVMSSLFFMALIYHRSGSFMKSIRISKLAISFVRQNIDSSYLTHHEVNVWSEKLLMLACSILLHHRQEIRHAAVGMKLFLCITANVRSLGKLRMLDEYASLLENYMRSYDYDMLFILDSTKIFVRYASENRASPSQLTDDIFVCDLLGYTYFAESFAKSKGEINAFMTRVNKTTFRLARLGFFKNLVSLYRSLFRHRVGTASLYRRLFLCLVSSGWHDEAIHAYQQYIRMMLKPERKAKIDPFLCVTASRCFLINKNDANEAIKAAELAVELSDKTSSDTNARAHHYLGLALAKKARSEHDAEQIKSIRRSALNEMDHARFLDPNNDFLLYDLAYMYAESMDIPLAIKTVRLSLKFSPGESIKWHLLALLYSCQKEYSNAINICDYIIKRDQNQVKHLNIFITKAALLQEQGKYAEALNIFHLIFTIWGIWYNKVKFVVDTGDLRGSHVGTLDPRGSTHRSWKNLKAAASGLTNLEGSVSLAEWTETAYPLSIKTYCRNIITQSALERRDAAEANNIEWFLKGQNSGSYLSSFGQMGPETMGMSKADFLGTVWIQVSRLYVCLDQLDDAEMAVHEALSLNELSPYFLSCAGHVHVAREEYEDALKLYGRALAIDPDYQEAFLGLGYCARKRGQDDLALHYYKLALSRNPFSFDAWLNLSELECNQFKSVEKAEGPELEKALAATMEKLMFTRELGRSIPVRRFSVCPYSL